MICLKGKSIYLTKENQNLVIASMEHYKKHLLEQYDKPTEKDEWYLNTAIEIRNLLHDKFEQKY